MIRIYTPSLILTVDAYTSLTPDEARAKLAELMKINEDKKVFDADWGRRFTSMSQQLTAKAKR